MYYMIWFDYKAKKYKYSRSEDELGAQSDKRWVKRNKKRHCLMITTDKLVRNFFIEGL